jgi:hypothetical protein
VIRPSRDPTRLTWRRADGPHGSDGGSGAAAAPRAPTPRHVPKPLSAKPVGGPKLSDRERLCDQLWSRVI